MTNEGERGAPGAETPMIGAPGAPGRERRMTARRKQEAVLRVRPHAIPALVGAYIAAGLWFAASTSFANPAVTVARALTRTFSGIAPADTPAFIAAQIAGAVLALPVARMLWPEPAFARHCDAERGHEPSRDRRVRQQVKPASSR